MSCAGIQNQEFTMEEIDSHRFSNAEHQVINVAPP